MKNSIEEPEVKRRFPLVGKEIEIIIYNTNEIMADTVMTDLYKEGLRLQKIFNFYDPESELSRLNQKRKMKVSPELMHVIQAALKYCRLTDGAYDISKGKQFLQRKKGQEVENVSCSYKDIDVQEGTIILQNDEVMIDLGSIAKGYIADRLVDMMRHSGILSGLVDARGDIRIFGNHSEIAEIMHPRKNQTINPIIFKNMAVATSGDYRQFDMTFDKSHIVGKKDFVSVTVVADRLMDADAAATCISLLSADEAKKFLSKQKGLKCFAMDSGLNSHYFNGFESILAEKAEEKRC